VIALAHVDLIVGDLERALAFYVGLLGCEVAADVVLEGAVPAFYGGPAARRMRLVMLRLARFGAMIELMALEPPQDATPGSAHPSVVVDDLDATRARLAAAGVAPASEMMTVELPRLGCARIAFVRDPDGYLVELVEPRR
jgi:catechol 2,3-dioxygenase-like lactoylglutathione lyase family enzyme